MSGKVYRIRGLEWNLVQGAKHSYKASSMFGYWWVMQEADSEKWHYASPLSAFVPCDSLSDGKAKCEALYRERMERGLEEVKDG